MTAWSRFWPSGHTFYRGLVGVPCAHHVKRMLQVGGIVRFHRGPHVRTRMAEFQLHGVQPLPFKAKHLAQLRIRAVHGVPANGCPMDEKCTRI